MKYTIYNIILFRQIKETLNCRLLQYACFAAEIPVTVNGHFPGLQTSPGFRMYTRQGPGYIYTRNEVITASGTDCKKSRSKDVCPANRRIILTDASETDQSFELFQFCRTDTFHPVNIRQVPERTVPVPVFHNTTRNYRSYAGKSSKSIG